MGRKCWETKGEMRVGKAFQKRRIKVLYQYNKGPYIIDIFLPQFNASIEVHGPHHVIHRRILKDIERSRFIESTGIREYIITAQDTKIPGKVRELVNMVVN